MALAEGPSQRATEPRTQVSGQPAPRRNRSLVAVAAQPCGAVDVSAGIRSRTARSVEMP